MLRQGQLIADYIGNHKAIYTGNSTMKAAGDIVLDNGETIELVSTSSGNGTYFNTSIYYFLKLGLDFKKYMEYYGLYSAIDKIPNIKANRNNNSPVTQNSLY